MEEVNVYDTDLKTKKTHPKERANFVSNLFFGWTLSTFLKGYKRELKEGDLYGALKAHKSSKLGDKLETVWDNQRKIGKISLWKVLWEVFGNELILTGLYYFLCEFILKISQPILISKLMEYYEPNQTEITQETAYICAGLIILFSFVEVIICHSYILVLDHLGMKVRVACCSLIYRKVLKLHKSSMAETTIGQMVNLLSNDVNRFDLAVIHAHSLWVAPLVTFMVLYLLYANVGVTGLTGVGFLLLFIPLQMFMGNKTSEYRLKTALRTDVRVRLMNEILSGIQVIKMYTWEKAFSKMVDETRRSEIRQISNNSFIRALTFSFTIFMNRIAVFLCILTFMLTTKNEITAQYVFVVTSFYGLLRDSLTMYFPQGITQLAETSVSIKRIQKFLLYEEVESKNVIIGKSTSISSNLNDKKGIFMKNVYSKWSSSSCDYTLSDISFNVAQNELVVVVGAVGSGKTSLLNVFLKELSPHSGTVVTEGVISYASQEPWLFPGSVRQNILFGQNFEPKKYEEVIKACALQRDFQLFPHGDRTIVGERGAMLSGGQRARINLARAIYKNADIYLLDDPLSAVDAHVGKQLFDSCICGYLKNKVVVLVTHQLQYLKNVNKIYLMEAGRVIASGSFEELSSKESYFTEYLSKNKGNEDMDQQGERLDRTKSSSTVEIKNGGNSEPDESKEEREVGKIGFGVYKTYLNAGGHWSLFLFILLFFVLTQFFASGSDYFATYWVNLVQEHKEEQVYYNVYFFNSTQQMNEWLLTEHNSLIVFGSLFAFLVIITLLRGISFFTYCMSSSVSLHNKMFTNLVRAPMQFFNNNSSGRILNRFSKDMGTIDEVLPTTIIDTIQIALSVGGVTVIIGILNPWILIPTFAIVIIFYILRMVFVKTSRCMKRMEGTTRSPVFTHLSTSLQGLTTIRAFGSQESMKNQFDKHQDLHSSAYFWYLGCNRAFALWLDLHCVLYIAFVTATLIFIENEIYGGNVGLAITQAMTLTGTFQWGIRQWSELENQMTSVERVIEYTEIPSEFENDVKQISALWPEFGKIIFKSVSLKYSENEPYILKRLNFTINPKEKIGIVGRTGAGKSSLISSLFRTAHIDGEIIIDNVNTALIKLHSLRSKISIIPQEPFLFSGTLRQNLDPLNKYMDDLLWQVLEEVELKPTIQDLPCGLYSKISEGGANFSVGQKQLLCLARAIILDNKILVLDEATANVDPKTDALIQKTIRNKFKNCTVLTVAHRLHTIMDSDKVMVMDAGCLVEFDHPHVLLQNEEGVFYGLVKETGTSMFQNLYQIAEKVK